MNKPSRSVFNRSGESAFLARWGFALLVAMMSAPAIAALPPTSAGFPDPTFGDGGAQVFSTTPGADTVDAILPMPSGHWLISGSFVTTGFSGAHRYLARLFPDGRFDWSFGTHGFVTDTYPSGVNGVVAVQATGKILSTDIRISAGLARAVLVRLQPDGTRDIAFGEGNGETVLGTAVATLPDPTWQNFESLSHDAQGRIIATTAIGPWDFEFIASKIEVWRFSANGIPDPSFGTNGHVLLDDLAERTSHSIVRAQPDGKLLIAADCYQPDTMTGAVCIVRLNASGARDAGFGPNGVRRIDSHYYPSDSLRDLTVAPDGKIYVATTRTFEEATALAAIVYRLNSDGTPDMTYGGAGSTKPMDGPASANAIHVLPDGRQIVVGSVEGRGYVNRLTQSGGLDPTFGIGGIAPSVMPQNHGFNKVVVLADGAVLAGGSAGTDSLLARIVGVETTTNVIEFHNTILNHYFITADPAEAASIDAGGSGPGWTRTGKTWKSGGPSRACRSYGSADIDPATGLRRGPNSHVFSMDAAECVLIRADSGWRFESYDFSGWLRLAPACPAGTIGVYRAYNNRFAFKDSNHRHTTELSTYNSMLAQGWLGEGIVFCASE
jgi:uncharacterized delta-60 repeat protein